MLTILDAARVAYAAGLCLLPTRNDGSKAPDVTGWKDFQTTRPTVAQMKGFDFAHRSGLGVVAGPASAHRECWDFDCNDVFTAFVAAAAACGLDELVGRLTAGYLDVTPGGGRRILATYPADVVMRDVTLAARPGRGAEPKVKTLIELPTFAIVAPSNGGTHPTGNPYVRVSGGFETIASYTATERQALIELARTFDQMPRRPATSSSTKPDAAGSRPGDDYTRRTTWSAVLEPYGWRHQYDRGEIAYWCRPGKSSGVSATTNIGGSDLFYPFTSSTEFERDRSYSKFAVYAVLEHGGDFGRAAQVLADKGFGEPVKRTPRDTHRPAAPSPAEAASWRWLADVERGHVEWLWRSRLALGSITIWMGDGGLGKSRASNDVAARITTGALWPDGESAALGSVVILSAEDSASYTIRPAIEAAGGDLRRIAVLDAVTDAAGAERTFNLGTDLAALEQIVAVTKASLIIIDPLSAYFGTTLDSYRDTDVRSVLEPICRLAERRRVAVLGIMHIGKGGDRQARHRALGSVGFVNAARLVFAVGADPEDETRRLLLPVKANLCREAPTLAFRLEDADGIARVAWESAPVSGVTADVVLNGRPVGEDTDQRGAADLLRQLLDDDQELWPMPAKAVAAAAQAHGIHIRSLQRAAQKLGVSIRKSGFRSGWFWFRPVATEDDTAAAAAPEAPTTDESEAKATAKTTQDDRVYSVSSSADLSSSAAPKTTLSSSSSSSNIQQKTPIREDDIRVSTRAREGEDVPAWVLAPEAPLAPTDPDAPFADPRRLEPELGP